MTRLAAKFVLSLAMLALAACAAPPEVPVTTNTRPAAPPGGNWVVVADYAAEAVGSLASPYMGQVVTLDQSRAIDAAGRLCKMPSYSQSEAPAGITLGNPVQPQAALQPRLRKIVTVTCEGQIFSTLVALPDGTWLTRINGWVLALAKEPAAKPVADVPVPDMPKPDMTVLQQSLADITQPPVSAPAKMTGNADPRIMVYLASYKTEAAAKSGFAVLAKASPILAKQQPVTQSVDLGKKGRWVRLYGMAADATERSKICGQLGKRVDECGAHNRE